MTRDPFVLGGVGGLIGATVMSVLSHLAFQLGFANVSTLHYAQRVTMHVAAPFTPAVLAVGFAACVLIGGLFGILLAFLYTSVGTDFRYIKGAVFGLLSHYAVCNFVVPIALPWANMPQTAVTSMIFFVVHIIYGLVTAHVILRYGRFAVA